RVGARGEHVITAVWWVAILSASVLRLCLSFGRLRGFALHDILPQAGLGYVFAFALSRLCLRNRAPASVGVLAAYWLAFLLFPVPGPGFDVRAVGVEPGDQVFTGYFAHWNKGTNLAAAFDVWFLNLFPTPEPHVFNPHGYQTLNFIPTIVTMVL